MITGIHFLLSYRCNLKCDHCFLHCSPTAKGTMTIAQIKAMLEECKRIGTVRKTYFEGGEPFLFYPVMVEGIRLAREMGFSAGIVSNGYWATSVEDAKLWLKPLLDLGVSNLSISDDAFHYGDAEETPAKRALAAAEALGMSKYSLCKTTPEIQPSSDPDGEKGSPEISGGIKLRGRAVDKFAEELPKTNRKAFRECPYENLADPKRVHTDSYGNVQICQGISMGNCWETPLSELVKGYDAQEHPICGPLIRGGPDRLTEEYGLDMEDEYVDACHLCYVARLALLDKWPAYLAPRQVYGLDEEC